MWRKETAYFNKVLLIASASRRRIIFSLVYARCVWLAFCTPGSRPSKNFNGIPTIGYAFIIQNIEANLMPSERFKIQLWYSSVLRASKDSPKHKSLMVSKVVKVSHWTMFTLPLDGPSTFSWSFKIKRSKQASLKKALAHGGRLLRKHNWGFGEFARGPCRSKLIY